MRVVPIITAVAVSAFLYFLIIERQSLLGFARKTAPEATVEMGSGTTGSGDNIPEDSDSVRVGVVAVHSTARSIDSAVLLRGQTEAARQVDVRAETTGQMIVQPLRKGAYVSEGQLLCKLDPGTREANLAEAKARLAEAEAGVPESEARLAEAEARLDEAGINLNAASKLSEGGFASETRVASAQAASRAAEAGVQSAKSGLKSTLAGIQSAQAGVAAAQKEIDRLSITAPFDGLLESDVAELGSLLQAGTLCATIIQLDPIKIVGFVPETEVSKVQIGAPAGAELATGDTLRGRVTFLSRSADPTTRTFRVEVNVPNPALHFRDGQTAEIAIAAEGASAHLLPQSALTLSDDGVLGVRIVTPDNKAEFVAVKLMRDTVQGVWLTGLPEKADVIIIGQEYVSEGVSVQAAFQEMTQ